MKKILIFIMLILLVPIVTATTNLDFRLDVEERGFYPNEKVPLNVIVVNRDATFAARDAELTVSIGDRFYTFDLGDLKPTETFQKEIILPEFPAGTHSIKGEINYTGILDERFLEVSYGSFEVLFPPIERYPRNVYVSGYDLPEKIISGKEYEVSITITNDGEVSADLLVEFGSIDEFFEEKTQLNPGESTTVKMKVKFENGGVSLIEARAYALINGEKYLLNYRGKKTYVQTERKAKLIFDKIELVGEGDNKINQEDKVKFKVFIKNEGDTATDVKGELSSNIEKINIIDPNVSYITIANKDGVAPSEDMFEIETSGVEKGDYELDLKLNYIDSENREKEIKVPISINEGGDVCTKDTDCSDTQTCENNQCVEVPCECGYVEDRKCISYECCSDTDCEEYLTCNQEIYVCEIPTDLTRDVLIITIGNKIDKTDSYEDVLREYQDVLNSKRLSSIYLELDSEKIKILFNTEITDQKNWRNIKDVIDKIIYKTKAKYILILGGVEVIPQPLAKTSARIPEIPTTDDRYADLDLDGIPDISIGRIPTPSNERSTQFIEEGLKSAIKLHNKNKLTSKYIIANPCGTAGGCNRYLDNNLISNILFGINDCSNNPSCKIPPPYCLGFGCDKKDDFKLILSEGDLLYFGSHGSGTSFAANDDEGWYTILSGNDLYKNKLGNSPIVIATACHGGTIDCEEGSCYSKSGTGFAFISNGASNFIANTRYGYRHTTPKLFNDIFVNMEKGSTIGEAFLKMKRDNLETSQSDWFNAVVYELQLYGDPTIEVSIR